MPAYGRSLRPCIARDDRARIDERHHVRASKRQSRAATLRPAPDLIRLGNRVGLWHTAVGNPGEAVQADPRYDVWGERLTPRPLRGEPPGEFAASLCLEPGGAEEPESRSAARVRPSRVVSVLRLRRARPAAASLRLRGGGVPLPPDAPRLPFSRRRASCSSRRRRSSRRLSSSAGRCTFLRERRLACGLLGSFALFGCDALRMLALLHLFGVPTFLGALDRSTRRRSSAAARSASSRFLAPASAARRRSSARAACSAASRRSAASVGGVPLPSGAPGLAVLRVGARPPDGRVLPRASSPPRRAGVLPVSADSRCVRPSVLVAVARCGPLGRARAPAPLRRGVVSRLLRRRAPLFPPACAAWRPLLGGAAPPADAPWLAARRPRRASVSRRRRSSSCRFASAVRPAGLGPPGSQLGSPLRFGLCAPTDDLPLASTAIQAAARELGAPFEPWAGWSTLGVGRSAGAGTAAATIASIGTGAGAAVTPKASWKAIAPPAGGPLVIAWRIELRSTHLGTSTAASAAYSSSENQTAAGFSLSRSSSLVCAARSSSATTSSTPRCQAASTSRSDAAEPSGTVHQTRSRFSPTRS